MTKHEPGVLHLEYLGERNYITVSQIIQGYFNLTNNFWNPANMERFRVRIKAPIKKHCRLIDPVAHANLSWDKASVAVEFDVKESGRMFKHLLVSDGEEITGRGQDFQTNWDEILEINGDTVRLTQPTKTHVADSLMGIGKALIFKSTPCLQPRVVDFFITEFIRNDEAIDCYLQLDPIAKNDFMKLKLFKNSRLVGHLWFWTGLG